MSGENQRNKPLLRMEDISKRFVGITALDHVNFSADAGEVHALMGENGAGKSTLLKILSGAYTKDTGKIYLNGEEVEITGPRSSRDLGISVIYQELALIPHLTVAENLFIDDLTGSSKFVDWKGIRTKAQEIMNKLGFGDIDVMQPVSQLSVAYMQVIEIAKALSRDSKVLVFDEPTAVLTDVEVEKLFRIINDLKKRGVCIIYVSHRLKEIFSICDRITILKDGKYVDCVNTSVITEEKLVTMMVGRKTGDMFPKRTPQIGKVIFEAHKLNSGKLVKDVSFDVRAGEILGFSGLVGAGRTETMQLIFGSRKKDSGILKINGEEVSIDSPKKAVKYGIGMLQEDRKNNGVILKLPIYMNGTMSILDKLSGPFGIINRKKEREVVKTLVGELEVKTNSVEKAVSTLSGGNQQKVSLLKWLAAGGKILILDEPTRGVDVGAKAEIYKIIDSLAQKGMAIIMISSEMTEIIGMCDRAIIMRQGQITGELEKRELSEQNLIKFAMGVK